MVAGNRALGNGLSGAPAVASLSRLALAAALGLVWAGSVAAMPITKTVGPTGDFTTLGAAAAAEVSTNTYTFNITPGTYINDFAVFKADTILNGTGVTEIANAPDPNLKGLFQTTSSLTVNGMALIALPGFGIPLGDGGNAALIREQSNTATQLIVNNAVIEGGQMGILTGSDSGNTHLDQVTITKTQFINNGAQPRDPNNGVFGHALYVGDAASLTVTGSLFCGQEAGHDAKSRAASTTITGSTFYVGTTQGGGGAPAACNVGTTSNAIDLPDGGVGTIDMNQIFQGDATQNGSLIRFGEEGGGVVFANNSLSVTNTSFDNLGAPNNPNDPHIAIDQPPPHGCIAPVSGVASDTFSNLVSINPPTCVAAPTAPIASVPEPRSFALLSCALMGLFLVRRRLSS